MQELDISKIVVIPSEDEIPVHDNPVQTKRPMCAEFPQNTIVLDKLEAVFNPLNVTECAPDLFSGDYETINKIDDLKKALSELLVRFDTAPGNYTKSDYSYLMGLLYKSLLHLYETNTASAIINEWSEEPREDLVPSEKLILDKLDEIVTDIDESIDATNVALNTEINNRQNADTTLQGNIDTVSGQVTQEVTDRQNAINDLLPLIYAGL